MKTRISKTTMGFWLEILGLTLKDITDFQPIRDKLMELMFLLILTLLIIPRILPFPDFELDLKSAGAVLISLIIARVVQGLFAIPARLYFETKEEADKHTWNGIEISEYNPTPDSVLGIGLKIKSEKPFDTIISRPILESAHKGKRLLSELGVIKIEMPTYTDYGGISRRRFKVNKNISEIVAIGTWDNDEAELFTEGQIDKKIIIEPSIEYKITIRFYGETYRCILPIRDISATVVYEDGRLTLEKTNDRILNAWPPREEIEK